MWCSTEQGGGTWWQELEEHVLLKEVAVAWLVGEAVWAETGQVGGQLWRVTGTGQYGRGISGAGPHLEPGSLNFSTSVPQVSSTKKRLRSTWDRIGEVVV